MASNPGPTPLQLLDAAFRHPGLSAPEKAVLVALARRANRAGRCYPGIPHLADMTSTSPSTVKRALAGLRDRGLVTTTRRRREDAGALTGTLAGLNYQLNLRNLGLTPPTDDGQEDWAARELARRKKARRKPGQ